MKLFIFSFLHSISVKMFSIVFYVKKNAGRGLIPYCLAELMGKDGIVFISEPLDSDLANVLNGVAGSNEA